MNSQATSVTAWRLYHIALRFRHVWSICGKLPARHFRSFATLSTQRWGNRPAHGKLKRLNISTFEYKAKARYIREAILFAIKAMGQGPTASGTSVIIVHATIK
jgi:hypothetical protein